VIEVILCIVGPTGVGKTKLSVELAKHYNAIVVNADSMQVYKELNIGTAKVREEEKEGIDLYDYVDEKYHKYLDESKKYQGIINTKSQAPCGYLIYQGNIKREIGLIKCKSEATGKEVITTVIDGMVAENYKFVKNDLLKVDIWLTINKIFEKIGIPTYSVKEMTKAVDGDKKTWNIYANGYTMGVNQCESDFGRQCCKRYKPQNMQELTALVAALRPGFKTQLNNFLDRKDYTTGVEALDNLLEDSFHYMMYQENIMTYLGWLGIDQTETYAIIKKISKKKFKDKELAELKEKLINGWIKNVGTSEGFEKTWEIIEAASKYSFNASHAYSYAYDSVYGAYLKAHYPYEFYSVMLQFLSEKGDKDKVSLYKKEMEQAFNIKEGEYKFRADNRTFSIDRENHCINPSLLSLKGFNLNVAEELYDLRNNKYSDFLDLLIALKNKTSLNKTQIRKLIQLDYFSEFGDIKYLLKHYDYFNLLYSKQEIKKEKIAELGLRVEDVVPYITKETEKKYMGINMHALLKNLLVVIKAEPTLLIDKIEWQKECLGYIRIADKLYKGLAYVNEIDTQYSPKLKLYALANGNLLTVKIDKRTFNGNKISEGDILRIENYESKPQCKLNKKTGKYEEIPGTQVLWIKKYKKVVI
jgi:DNA polymerase III alpha subunit